MSLTIAQILLALQLPGWRWTKGMVAVWDENGVPSEHIITSDGLCRHVSAPRPGAWTPTVTEVPVPAMAIPRFWQRPGVPDTVTVHAMLELLGTKTPWRVERGVSPFGGPEAWRVRPQGDGRWRVEATREVPVQIHDTQGEAAVALALALGYWVHP